MQLAYLLTYLLFQFLAPVEYLFVNKCCELKQHLAWHWPDHHWQCNWRVAWTSSSMCAGKRWTLRATIVTIFSHLTRNVSVFVKCDRITRLFFWKLPQIRTSNICKVVWHHTEGTVGSFTWVLFETYSTFQQWKNFENPLKTDKVITMGLVYNFLGTQCIPTEKVTYRERALWLDLDWSALRSILIFGNVP